MFEYTSTLLKIWVHNGMKDTKLIFLLMIISYFTIFTECLNTIARLINIYRGIDQLDAEGLALSKLNAVNPLHYLQKQILFEKISISYFSATDCSIDNTLILIISGIVSNSNRNSPSNCILFLL